MKPAGIYVRFGSTIDEAVNAEVHRLTRRLIDRPLAGVTDLVPGYSTLYVEYDSERLTERRVFEWLRKVKTEAPAEEPVQARRVEIPVEYDGEDLAAVASETGLGIAELVERHASHEYRVYALGFLPGFPFLGEVPLEIRVPRRIEPRPRVPAHSLAIAGSQTGIYPLPSPGGWKLLGHTLVRLYDPTAVRPFLLGPGDTVRFVSTEGPLPAPPDPLLLLPGEPRHPALLVREPGLLDLVVDEGREMMGRFGLGRSGPLDFRSARIANALIGNARSAPLLELNLQGPVLEAVGSTVVSFTGYGTKPVVNGAAVEPFSSFALRPGDVLTFGPDPRRAGCRAYLALPGGIESDLFAGSASVDLRGLIGRQLVEGDLLGQGRAVRSRAGRSFTPHRRPFRRLRLLPGPQASTEAERTLAVAEFTVATADRVGLRLEGPPVAGGEVLSEGVPLGALQVPPNGQPILLLADHGSLGGYEKPAILHPDDLPLAGQLRAGDRLKFELVGDWRSATPVEPRKAGAGPLSSFH